jgi:hypothetical protein
MSQLGRWDCQLVRVIGWAYRRLSPAARQWLAQELRWREGGR